MNLLFQNKPLNTPESNTGKNKDQESNQGNGCRMECPGTDHGVSKLFNRGIGAAIDDGNKAHIIHGQEFRYE